MTTTTLLTSNLLCRECEQYGLNVYEVVPSPGESGALGETAGGKFICENCKWEFWLPEEQTRPYLEWCKQQTEKKKNEEEPN